MRRARWLMGLALVTACGGGGTASSAPGDDGGPDATGTTDAANHGDAIAGKDAGGGDASGDAGDASGGEGGGGGDGGPITTHPTNILNNGGFEYGAMCYGQYEWGANPANVGTGYKFSLSTSDVHGGKYAAQIACVNPTDCGYPAKAALQAAVSIHTPHDQAYVVSAWTKCPAGDSAYFYSPTTTDSTPPFSCTGAWAQTSFSFTTTATDDYLYYALYYAGKGTFLVDDVVMTYGDGSVPAQTVKHAGTRPVSVTNGVYQVDGKPFVPLGFYGIPAEGLAAAKQMGVNAVAWGDPGCFNSDAAPYADQAYEAGINLVPESSTTARMGDTTVFPGALHQFGAHLADIAWYLDDEPDQSAIVYQPITPGTLTAEYQAIHGASSLPVGVMLQHAHYDPPAIDQPYAPAMDVYLSEPYGASFDGITQSMTVFGAMTPRPVWFAMDDGPDNGQIVVKAYYGFVSGGSGLLYFTWDTFQTNGKLKGVTQAITELSSLGDVLTGTDVTGQVTGPNGIALAAKQAGGKTYVLAVNPGTPVISGNFSYAPLTAGKTVTVQFENRTITAAGGYFSDTFNGVSRHVYVID